VIRLAALVVLAVAAAPSLPARGQADKLTVIKLISITTSERRNDVPPRGISVGDSEFSTSRLVNAVPQFGKAKGAVVGSDRSTTTLRSISTARVEGTATLPGGTLLIYGTVRFIRHGQVFPIAGGTGAFARAHGTVTISPLGNDDRRALNVYRLTYG
jgi:hypothetical protein